MSAEYGVVLFPSTQQALRGEKVLKGAGLPVKLIPVPRQISSDCGICLRIPWETRAEVETVLSEAGLSFPHIVPVE